MVGAPGRKSRDPSVTSEGEDLPAPHRFSPGRDVRKRNAETQMLHETHLLIPLPLFNEVPLRAEDQATARANSFSLLLKSPKETKRKVQEKRRGVFENSKCRKDEKVREAREREHVCIHKHYYLNTTPSPHHHTPTTRNPRPKVLRVPQRPEGYGTDWMEARSDRKMLYFARKLRRGVTRGGVARLSEVTPIYRGSRLTAHFSAGSGGRRPYSGWLGRFGVQINGWTLGVWTPATALRNRVSNHLCGRRGRVKGSKDGPPIVLALRSRIQEPFYSTPLEDISDSQQVLPTHLYSVSRRAPYYREYTERKSTRVNEQSE